MQRATYRSSSRTAAAGCRAPPKWSACSCAMTAALIRRGSNPTLVSPATSVSSNRSPYPASMRTMPSDVVSAQVVTAFCPMKYRLSKTFIGSARWPSTSPSVAEGRYLHRRHLFFGAAEKVGGLRPLRSGKRLSRADLRGHGRRVLRCHGDSHQQTALAQIDTAILMIPAPCASGGLRPPSPASCRRPRRAEDTSCRSRSRR